MRYLSVMLTGILAAGLLAQPAFGQTTNPTLGQPATTEQKADPLSTYVQAIEQAPDPSAAIAAYAHGVSVAPGSHRLLAAFVDRMVDFDLPEVAYHQAQVLVDIDPTNGQAWAVLSHMSARHGQMMEALADIVQAANREPDSEFVQSTAGELLAWYDRNQSLVPDSLRTALEKVRKEMSGQKAYADAYKQAQSELRQASGTQQTQSGTQEYPATYAPESVYPAPAYDYSSLYSLYYPLYPGAISYPSYCPYYYYPSIYSSWWWPYGPFFSTGFFFGFHHHHHFFDHDDFFFHHGHDFDRFHHGFAFHEFHGHHGVFGVNRFSNDRGIFAVHGGSPFTFHAGRGPFDFGTGRGLFGGTRSAFNGIGSGFSRPGGDPALGRHLGLTVPGIRTPGLTGNNGSGIRTPRFSPGASTHANVPRMGISPGAGVSRGLSTGVPRSTSPSYNMGGTGTRTWNLGGAGIRSNTFGGSGFRTGVAPMPRYNLGSGGFRTGGFSSNGFSTGAAPMRSYSFGSSGFRGGGFGGGFHGGGFHGGGRR